MNVQRILSWLGDVSLARKTASELRANFGLLKGKITEK